MVLSALALIAILLSISMYVAISGDTQIELGRIVWSVYENPSGYKDVAYSVCGYGQWIYVVGSEGSSEGLPIPRIEKRFKNNGTLVSVWRGEGVVYGEFKDCVALGEKVYAVGYAETGSGRTWLIAVFDSNLKPLNISTKRGFRFWSEAISIAAYNGILYVAGFRGENASDTVWRVEMLSPELAVVKVYESNPSPLYDMLTAFGINPVTGDVWIAGLNSEKGSWRIEILSSDLERKYVFENSLPGLGLPNAITFDEAGRAYVAGAGIAVFDAYGNLQNITATFGYCPKILYLDGVLYLFCTAIFDNYNRHVLYIIDREEFVAFMSILSKEIDAYAYFANGKVYTDGEDVYVAGSVELEDEGGWIIYRVEGVHNIVTVQYVLTSPATTTVTLSINFKEFVKAMKSTSTPTTQYTQSIASTISTKVSTTEPESTQQKPAEEKQSIESKNIVSYLVIAILIAVVAALLILFIRRMPK